MENYIYVEHHFLHIGKNATIGGDTMEYTKAIVINDKPIKPYGNTAHVYVPKKFLGKRASILIHLDDDENGEKEEDDKK
jgi:putative transposon-encoded protein